MRLNLWPSKGCTKTLTHLNPPFRHRSSSAPTAPEASQERNAFPKALTPRQGSSGRKKKKNPEMQTWPQRTLLFKTISIGFNFQSHPWGTVCTGIGIPANTTFQKSTVTPLTWPTTKSLLKLVETSSVSWKLQMRSDTGDFLFPVGLRGGQRNTHLI